MATAKTAILFITHNRLELTRQAFDALLYGGEYDIYAFDNGSTDGTAEFMKYNKPHLSELVLNDRNLGIAPVQNWFWREYSREYRFVGKIDNDVVVPFGWCYECTDRLNRNPELLCVSMFHWHPSFIPLVDSTRLHMGNGVAITKFVGGNYLARSEVFKRFGPVIEDGTLKGGFTRWQLSTRKPSGFVYPFEIGETTFRQPFHDSLKPDTAGPILARSQKEMELLLYNV